MAGIDTRIVILFFPNQRIERDTTLAHDKNSTGLWKTVHNLSLEGIADSNIQNQIFTSPVATAEVDFIDHPSVVLFAVGFP